MKTLFVFKFLLIFCLFISSCEKKDPSPELSDEIYKDLKQEIEIAEKNLQAELAQNEKVKKELLHVRPQTGENKIAEKKITESNKSLDLFKQQLKYFEIKQELRKQYVRGRYLESLSGGRPWPDKAEAEDYRLRLKLQRAKLDWNKKPAEKKSDVKKSTEHGGTPQAGGGEH